MQGKYWSILQCTSISASRANASSSSAFLAHPMLGLNPFVINKHPNMHQMIYTVLTVGCCQWSFCRKCSLNFPDWGNVICKGSLAWQLNMDSCNVQLNAMHCSCLKQQKSRKGLNQPYSDVSLTYLLQNLVSLAYIVRPIIWK